MLTPSAHRLVGVIALAFSIAVGLGTATPVAGSAAPAHFVDTNPATNGTYVHPGTPRNGCKQLGYIGDSLSDQVLGSWTYLTYGLNLYGFNYRINASIGRSVTSPGEGTGARAGSAADVARQFKAAGADCFVYAIGTNDAAQIKGDYHNAIERIATMMRIAGGARVRWVTPQTRVPAVFTTSPLAAVSAPIAAYSDANMAVFRRALQDSTKRYPNLTLDRWDVVAKESVAFWLPDGVHMFLVGQYRFAQFIVGSMTLPAR